MKLPVLSSLRGRAVMLVLLALIPALFLIVYTYYTTRESNMRQARLETLRLTAEFDPDVILLDLIMPGLSGLEVTQQLRQSSRFQDTIIIAVSASAFGITRQQSLNAGCTDFLSKPIQADNLLDMLQRRLGLTWIYSPSDIKKKVEPEPKLTLSVRPESETGLMVGPPPGEASRLFQQAQIGSVLDIQMILKELQEQDEQLVPFVNAANRLLKTFDFDAFGELVKPYVEAGYGV